MLLRYLIVLALCGCSASRRIATEASDISDRAARIETIASDIAGRTTDSSVVDMANEIAGEARAIEQSTEAIHSQIPGVIDRVPWWGSMITYLAIGAVCIAVCITVAWIIHSTGIGTAIRIAIGWLPRRKLQAAELAHDTLNPERKESARELVASLRTDPLFDAAYRRVDNSV